MLKTMSNSDRISGLRPLSWIWNLNPLIAGIIVCTVSFTVVGLLMMLEGRSLEQRELYRAFIGNDILFIPLYVAMTEVILRRAQPILGFCATNGYHLGVLILGFLASLLLEYGAVHSGQYTMSQELSPSKLYHTLLFGVVFYWMVAPLPAIIRTRRPKWAMRLLCLAVLGFLFMNYLDLTRPWPKNAHLNGTWSRYGWHAVKE